MIEDIDFIMKVVPLGICANPSCGKPHKGWTTKLQRFSIWVMLKFGMTKEEIVNTLRARLNNK